MRAGAPKFWALLALFFFSGTAALGYQIAWARMFSNGLGHEFRAVLSVLTAIFVGFCLGSLASDALLRASAKPGRWFGYLELIIGGWAFVSVALIPRVSDTGLHVLGLGASPGAQWCFDLALPCLTLLPATAAMGATFAAMETFISPVARPGPLIGALYAANTLGAVVGTLLGASPLFPKFGFSTAVSIFASVNLLCGVVALALERQVGERPRANQKRPAKATGARTVFGALLVTGFLGIGYEVLAVRVLGQVLENSIFTFVAVLAAYLIGTALGGAVYQGVARPSRSGTLLNRFLGALAVSSGLGVLILAHADTLAVTARKVLGPSAAASVGAEVVTALCVFLLPTLSMGAVFSGLVEQARARQVGIGKAVALNTLGSAVAPFIVGVLCLPALGAKWSFVVLTLGYLALAWTVGVKLQLSSTSSASAEPSGSPRLVFVTVIVAGLILLLPSEVRFVDVPPRGKLLAYKEGPTDSVAIVEHVDGNRSLLVDNRFTMGGTGAASAEKRHASIPLLLHASPKRALFLGLGTGITFAGAAAEPGLEADGVELLPEVVNALPWFAPQNSLPANSQLFRIYTADARRFVRANPDTYDVIVADLFHPARDGAGSLYTREHFQAIRARLAPGGLFCQWLPLFQLDQRTFQVILRTFLDVFPQTRAYLLRWTADTPVLGLVATLEPVRYTSDYFSSRVRDAGLKEQLNAEQLRDEYHLFGCFLCGPEMLSRLAVGNPLNTDDRPVVTFSAPALSWELDQRPYGRLDWLLSVGQTDVRELFTPDTNPGFLTELSNFITARNIYLRGLFADAEGQRARALELYLQSAAASELFPTAYAQCVTLAMQEAKSRPDVARDLLERLAQAQPHRPVAGELLRRLFESERR